MYTNIAIRILLILTYLDHYSLISEKINKEIKYMTETRARSWLMMMMRYNSEHIKRDPDFETLLSQSA